MSGGSELYLCTLTAHCKGTKQRRCCSHGSQALSKTENKLLGGTKEAFFSGRQHRTACLWPWVLVGSPSLTYWAWHILFPSLIFKTQLTCHFYYKALSGCPQFFFFFFFCAHTILSIPLLYQVAQLNMLLCLSSSLVCELQSMDCV